ncbi:MAG: FlgD immunoglobulin-like domain containing protein [Treponema sp.]
MHDWNATDINIFPLVNGSVWKKPNGSTWDYMYSAPSIGESDNIYFSGEIESGVRLVADVTVNDIIFSYQDLATIVNSGSNLITIDLNGHNLICNSFQFNNESLPANVRIIDSSGTPGTVTVKTTFSYSAGDSNTAHTLSIENGVDFTVEGGYSADSSGALKITSGAGSDINFSGTTVNDANLTINDIVMDAAGGSDIALWTGAYDENWDESQNWDKVIFGGSAVKYIIPTGCAIYPTAGSDLDLSDCSVVIEGNASATFNGNTAFSLIEVANNSTVKFNQGTGGQTATVNTLSVSGGNIYFGNDKDDIFNAGSGGINALDIAKAASVTVAGTIKASELIVKGNIDLLAETTIEAPVKLSNDTSISDTSNILIFQQNITGSYKFSASTESVWFRGDIDIGEIFITKETQFLGSASTIKTTGNQTYNGKVVINVDDVNIISDGTITFNSDISTWQYSGVEKSVNIGNDAKTTEVIFNSTVGLNRKLNVITISGNLISKGDVTANEINVTGKSSLGANVTTAGKQTYTGQATLTADVTMLAGTNTVSFSSGINSNTNFSLQIGDGTNKTNLEVTGTINLKNITVYGRFEAKATTKITCIDFKCDGNSTFRGDVDATSISVLGETVIGEVTSLITTTSAQTYTGAFRTNSNITLLAGSGSIEFGDVIGSYNGTPHSITIGNNTSSTNAVFNGNIGTETDKILKQLTVYGTSTFNNGVSNVMTEGIQSYEGDVTCNDDIIFSAGTDSTTEINVSADFTGSSVTVDKGKFAALSGNFSASGDLTVNAGAEFNFGANSFSCGILKVEDGGSFIQTGDNGANAQKAGKLVNYGSMVWDSGANGGSLEIGTDGTEQTDINHLIVFNNKNINLQSSEISGIFYDLTIPDGVTITNSSVIVVRRNFTIINSGAYNDNSNKLYLGSYSAGGKTYDSAEGTISRNGLNTQINLGKVVISQQGTEKTFESDILISGLTFEDAASTGNIVFQKNLTISAESNINTKGSISFGTGGLADNPYTTKFDANVLIDNASSISIDGKLDNSARLSISAGRAINSINGFTLQGSGAVILGTDSSSSETVIQSAGDISFNGTGTIILKSPVKISKKSGTDKINIAINQDIQGTNDASNQENFTLDSGTGKITLSSSIGGGTNLKNVSFTGGEIILNSTGKIGAKTSSIKNTGLLRLKEGSEIYAKDGFSKTGTGLSQIASTIKTNNGSVSFNTTTYIDGTTTIDTGNSGAVANPTSKITVGISASDDLYISALDSLSKSVSFIADTLDVKGNVVLFNGDVSLKANLTSGKDIVLLKGDSPGMYNDTESGVNGLFAYQNPLRTAANNLCPPSLAVFPEKMPDQITEISNSRYISALKDFAGKTITAGQNFYDNGVNLTPLSSWTLNIKDNDNAKNSFAEFYNARISYCTVTAHDGEYAWLSAREKVIPENENSINNDKNAAIIYNDDGSYERQKTGVAFLHPIILADVDSSISSSEGRSTSPEVPNLSGTYSVRDNVIRIEFVRSNYVTVTEQKFATALIENSNNEISKAISSIKYDKGTTAFIGSYIDAECTTSTDGKGDIAVFYLKAPDDKRWNIDATGIESGTKGDMEGKLNLRFTDIEIQKALDSIFATLTDEHKNRIGAYYEEPLTTPSSSEGYRFTATTSRCALDEMHITFALADFKSDKIYLYFDKPLSDNITWKTYNPGTAFPTEAAIKLYSSLNTKDDEFKVEKVDRNKLNKNGLVLILNKPLSYNQIQYGIKIEYDDSYLFNNKIHSDDRYVVISGEAHCISDFLVNAVEVQYAYDDRTTDYSAASEMLVDNIIAVRDFSGETKNNKLFTDKNITLVTKDISANVDENGEPKFSYKLVADISPSEHCQGETFTQFSGLTTRAFFPAAAGGSAVTGFSPALNTSPNIEDSTGTKITGSTDTKTGITKYLFHNVYEESPCLNWQNGTDVRFLFEVLNTDGSEITINHKFNDVDIQTTPLYALRLKNADEFTSIDLWSFIVSEPQRQRGGVSIYSNVINASNRDICTLEVNMESAGSLRVIVMTADGNVVKYLENSRQSQGMHYYHWNGTNNSGNAVARGIYFIRVVGPGIDETRKVMVVK